jgi:hypothetical protein
VERPSRRVERVDHHGGAWERVKRVGKRADWFQSVWERVDHHGGAWERVKRVGKRADPSGGACRCVEAWTAVISSDLDSKRLICRLVRSVVHVQCRNRLRLHRSTDPGLRHHFWWFFWPRGVSVAAR